MNSSISFGIDVAKGTLVLGQVGKRIGEFGNTSSGLDKLRLKLPAGCMIHLESSGGYDRLARRTLSAWGYEVRLHNPKKVRRMSRCMGYTAKNDALDSQALAVVGPLIHSRPAKSNEQEELCDLSRTIQTFKHEKEGHEKRKESPLLLKECVVALEAVIKALTKQIAILEKQYEKLVKASRFKERYELLMGVFGIGLVTARILSCELPEDLDSIPTKAIGSYAGLAPIDDESGKRKGPRHIQMGNTHLKAAMYMAAKTALRHLEWAKKLYKRLKEQGRNHNQAIVPIMRKMLMIAVAVLKRGTAFTADTPMPKK